MDNERKVPEHIAIIMDGNGRWAKKRMQPRMFGHKAGMKALNEGQKISYTLTQENGKTFATDLAD